MSAEGRDVEGLAHVSFPEKGTLAGLGAQLGARTIARKEKSSMSHCASSLLGR